MRESIADRYGTSLREERAALIGETETSRFLTSFLVRVAALAFAVAVAFAAHTAFQVGPIADGSDRGHGTGTMTMTASTR